MRAAEQILTVRLADAVTAAFGATYGGWDAQLRAATRPEFGHFQTNLPLRLAKPLGRSPGEVGQRLLAQLRVDDVCLPPTLAGAGFVNLRLRPSYLAARVTAMLADERLGVELAAPPRRVVVDYSSPNVAKQMHVGHLRSTVIGDALVRVLAFQGHQVIRQNHVGDWGTQFGMLIEQLLDESEAPDDLDLGALELLYRRARTRFDADQGFADRCRARVVALQSGDLETLAIWRRLVATSLTAFQRIYDRLGALLCVGDVAGESGYNADLPHVVAELAEAGLLRESAGALCAFLPEFTGRDGAPLPLIVRKADGAFGYVATDLAAIQRRVGRLGATRLVYVVDARQTLHFEQVFALARRARWLPPTVTVEHVAFGTMLDVRGRPFGTRGGQVASLAVLLDEAEATAADLLDARGSDLPEPVRAATARAIGVGAVKYADLSHDLSHDYTYTADRMVTMDGDTGPYLQYAHVRLVTLLGKAECPAGEPPTRVDVLDRPAEQRLALQLLSFPGVVAAVADTLEPHRLCGHLYQTATALSAFYESCPVLRTDGAIRSSRLALCLATRRVLAQGLNLLGIVAPDRM